MPYQVTFNTRGKRKRGRTTDAFRLKPSAQKYADELNINHRLNARVVIAKSGTYDRIV